MAKRASKPDDISIEVSVNPCGLRRQLHLERVIIRALTGWNFHVFDFNGREHRPEFCHVTTPTATVHLRRPAPRAPVATKWVVESTAMRAYLIYRAVPTTKRGMYSHSMYRSDATRFDTEAMATAYVTHARRYLHGEWKATEVLA